MHARQRERLAAETTTERDVRLQQMSVLQRERLAAESAAERDIRLQRMRSKKTGDRTERDRARRAAETADQRSERLRN